MRIIILLFLTVACSQANLKSSNTTEHKAADASNSKNDESQSEKDRQSADVKSGSGEEIATRPVMISGGFLYCVDLLANQKLKQNALIGCRLNDAQGNKINTRSLANSVKYSFNVPENNSTNAVSRDVFETDSRYDSILDLSVNSAIEIKDIIKEVQITVELRSFLDGRPGITLTNPLSSVIFTPSEQSIVNSWQETCTGNYCQFFDSNTGLVWLPFELAQNYENAIINCQFHNVGTTTVYRLPTASEMFLARATQFSIGTYNANFNVPNENVWTSNLLPSSNLDPLRLILNPLAALNQYLGGEESINAKFACVTSSR